MKYSFKDVKDKTREGIEKELQEGLAIAAFYFYTTHGMPPEDFFDRVRGYSFPVMLNWYMNFRNENSKLFDKIVIPTY